MQGSLCLSQEEASAAWSETVRSERDQAEDEEEVSEIECQPGAQQGVALQRAALGAAQLFLAWSPGVVVSVLVSRPAAAVLCWLWLWQKMMSHHHHTPEAKDSSTTACRRSAPIASFPRMCRSRCAFPVPTVHQAVTERAVLIPAPSLWKHQVPNLLGWMRAFSKVDEKQSCSAARMGDE